MHKKLISIAIISIVCYLPAKGQNMATQPAPGDGMFTLNAGNSTMIIDGNIGSRVFSFKLDGIEILGTKDLNQRMYGSTLWLSPEGKWKGQGILDASGYTFDLFNRTDLRLKSQNDTLRGFSFMKEFHVSQADTSIIIKYTMTNISKDMQEVAPWEVTRVPTGGLAFTAKGSPENIPTPNKMYPLMKIIEINNVIWYPYDTSKVSAQKLFMEGGEGWIAYVKDRILFVKKIPVIASEKAAPNEKNIELYVNKEKTYIELENQGEYQNLMPGESLFYEVKWYARNLPAGLRSELGDHDLINYIRNIIKN